MEAEGPEVVSTLQAAKSLVKYTRKVRHGSVVVKDRKSNYVFSSRSTYPIQQVYEERHEKLEAHA